MKLSNQSGPPPRLDLKSRPSSPQATVHVMLASPRGFCAGVRRAIRSVEDALDHFGAPVYVRRPIVHNMTVVRALEAKGAVFVQEIEDVPPGGVVILSAHGSARQVIDSGTSRRLRMIDAMCPLVGKVQREVQRHYRQGRHVMLIGHPGHPEIEGICGQVPDCAVTVISSPGEIDRLDSTQFHATAYAIQTTFAADDARHIVDHLQAIFPAIVGPAGSDICYATTNRQDAIRGIAAQVDAVIVVGEDFSSNARRLAEVARAQGCGNVQLVADAAAIDWARLDNIRSLGITAAASTPESSVQSILKALGEYRDIVVENSEGVQENTVFKPVEMH